MTQLTPHFTRKEFECPCCGADTVDVELMKVINLTRLHFGKPLHIHSGFRCVSYNKEIGGAKFSKHLEGKAIDFHIDDTPLEKIYNYINREFPHKYGLRLYSTYIHFDVRPTKHRWRYD